MSFRDALEEIVTAQCDPLSGEALWNSLQKLLMDPLIGIQTSNRCSLLFPLRKDLLGNLVWP